MVVCPPALTDVVTTKEEEVQEVVTAKPVQPESSMLEDDDGDDDSDDDSDADSNLVRVWVGGVSIFRHLSGRGEIISSPWGSCSLGCFTSA